MSDLKTANSAIPKVLVAQQLTTAEVTYYTAATGKTTKLASAVFVNTTAGAINVWLSLVKTGGTAGDSNRVVHSTSLAAGARLDLGALGWLGPGDFVSAKASANTSIALVLTGVEFASVTAGALTGVQFDTLGAGNRVSTGTTCTWSHTVGTGTSRYLLAGFVVSHSTWMDYTAWDTLTVASNVDGGLTRLASAMTGASGQRTGSVHLFGRANPTAGAHTITVTAQDASVTYQQLAGNSRSYSGVSGTSGATAQDDSNSALSLTVTSSTNSRAVMAAAIDSGMSIFTNFNQQIFYVNGSDVGSSSADYLWLADAPGAASVSFTSSNTGTHAQVGVSLTAA